MRIIYFFLSLLLFVNATNAKPPHNAIATANPLASNAALAILEKGGNAFDAAITIAAVLAVTEPYNSGIGGGCFFLLHEAKSNKNIFIDAREMAPAKANKNMFLDVKGNPIDKLSLNGALAAAIPGEPAALVYVAKHFGKLPLKETLAPAIELAEQGFKVDSSFNEEIYLHDRIKLLQKYESTAKVFLQDKKPFPLGSILRQADLAKTLRKIAEQGEKGFYQGEVAENLVRSVNAAGGIWTLDDLASYKLKIRKPLEGDYFGMHIVTAPPPSAGGIGLLTMLNILSAYKLDEMSLLQKIHYITEAMRLAYWQRLLYLGDPDFVNIPIKHLLSKENAQNLRQYIKANAATPSTSFKGYPTSTEGKNTTHFSIIDREGNMVAATLTVNFGFGSGIIAAGTGVLLNDEMDDFYIKGDGPNNILPRKRPLSSMTPTFLEFENRVAILGTPGGIRIPTMVLLATLKFYESYGAISMVSRMRFHHQFYPDYLQFEPDTFSPKIQMDLQKMGYQLKPLKSYYGNMQAITWNKDTDFMTAASDPREHGLGIVY